MIEMLHSINRLSPKLMLCLVLLISCFDMAFAQVEYLRLSPSQKIVQRVGATDVTLSFSRPQAKGRQVFGGLVPYGSMWRTGANENTIIEFSHKVQFGSTDVDAGKYALFTKPFEEYWEIYLYTDINNLDVPSPIESTKLIPLITVPTRNIDYPEETLIINWYNITEHSAQLGIIWEKTRVDIPVQFYTHDAMSESIDVEMTQNIFDLVISANYLLQRDLELERAKTYMELAMKLRAEPNAWDYHSYGLILSKLGDHKAALMNVNRSLELSIGSANEYLINENKKLVSELEANK